MSTTKGCYWQTKNKNSGPNCCIISSLSKKGEKNTYIWDFTYPRRWLSSLAKCCTSSPLYNTELISILRKNKKHEHGKNKKMLYDPNKTEKWACVISMPLTSTSSPCSTLRAGRGWRLAGRFDLRRSDWLPERWLSNPKRKHEKRTLAYMHKLKTTQKHRKSEKNTSSSLPSASPPIITIFALRQEIQQKNIVRRCGQPTTTMMQPTGQ